jgi:hypothetical protein
MRLRASISALTAIVTVGLYADAATAACTRLSFSVNDYGKDGPTNDAKKLLDTYVAKWTAERGIKKYTTGKKSVTCELYLNLIVVDEHTCKAEASVCWDGAKVPVEAAVAPAAGAPQAKPVGAPSKAAPKAAKPAAALAPVMSPIATGTVVTQPQAVATPPAALTPALAIPTRPPVVNAPAEAAKAVVTTEEKKAE